MCTKVIAITGPPASGKSTISGMIDDLGVATIDTGEEMRAHANRSGEDGVWEFVTDLREREGPHATTKLALQRNPTAKFDDVICVSGLREQAEVDYIRENVGPTLVVRVDADTHARANRYVDSKLGDDEDRESVEYERVRELREELYKREMREMPYPDHDVSIRNEDSVQMYEIYRRLENLIDVIDG